MDLGTAFSLVKEKRAIAEPNIGFMVQLKGYEMKLFGKTSKISIRPNEKVKAEKTEKKEEATQETPEETPQESTEGEVEAKEKS